MPMRRDGRRDPDGRNEAAGRDSCSWFRQDARAPIGEKVIYQSCVGAARLPSSRHCQGATVAANTQYVRGSKPGWISLRDDSAVTGVEELLYPTLARPRVD